MYVTGFCTFKKILQKSSPETLPWVHTKHPKLGAFSYFPKYSILVATKYRVEAVLYSNRTTGYPLSPHIKTIAVAFLQAEI